MIGENNSANYHGTSIESIIQIEKYYKVQLQHKDEIIKKLNDLLEQQKREIYVLNDMIVC
ncbi:hypothetical protein QG034_00805 [Kingella kingae]|uniref:hypothetical protein n=1 Tax=Kingella kingae TaxID=504 RepID=UPI00068AA84F|nr:hypothetical protein [Kingella kingae]MDK4525461.1 hypothetical protein [Kingella kingae]MDK4531486.1 hypothetical protein [Kingella kingae]MDK4536100.1 hypothetical protein [Kingella kingae]MDK4538945.1 hypothetical protein [Kingella kingae]MDK4546096.1 hypothetical protein [Kingella kingae]